MNSWYTKAVLMTGLAFTLVICPGARAQDDSTQVQLTPKDIKWIASPATPPGGQIAVLVGKPGQAGPYAFRLRFPADYKVMPHSHPDERIYTVLSGTWYIGLGDKFDPVKLKAFPAGSIYVVPAKIHHFHWAKSGESIVQVNAVGPTATDYVDPANDPRKK